MGEPTTPIATAPVAETPAEPAAVPTLITREGEDELCNWVEALYEEAATGREELASDDCWDDWDAGFWGDLWPDTMPSFKPPIVANEMQTLFLSEISDLTDSPLIVFVQKDPRSGMRDEVAEKAIRGYWQNQYVDEQIMLACLDGFIKPCGFLSCTWDPTKAQGQGEIITRARDPRTVYPDPDAEDDDTWRYVILRDVMDVVEIRAMWPDQGWRVKPEARYSLKLDATQQASRSGKYKGPLYAPGSGLIADGFAKARATVLTLFIYDDQLEEHLEESVHPSTGEKMLKSTTRQKYPNGRLIQVCNGVVLYDGENPYWGRFPIVRVPMLPSPHTFWPPQSPVSGVLELYRSANKMESMVVENAIRLNAGLVVADANSGINPENFQNLPGQILLKTAGSQVEIKYPPQMPPDMVGGGERLRGIGRTVLGFPPSRVGTGQRGNVSAELSETEISQAMSLSRLRGRLLYRAVQKCTQMIFQRMAQFYRVPRFIPFVGNGSEWEPVPWIPLEESLAKLATAHVDPTSFTIRSKTMLQRLYISLAKIGKIPNEDLLKMLEIPDAAAISKRMNDELMLHAMAKGHLKPGEGQK